MMQILLLLSPRFFAVVAQDFWSHVSERSYTTFGSAFRDFFI